MTRPCAPAGIQVGSGGVLREQVEERQRNNTPLPPCLLGPPTSHPQGEAFHLRSFSKTSVPPMSQTGRHEGRRGTPSQPLTKAQEAARAGLLLPAHRKGNCPEPFARSRAADERVPCSGWGTPEQG